MQLSDRIEGSDFLDVDRLSGARPKNDIIIYVRKFDPAHANFCKSMGLKVGFDVADNPVTDFLYGRVKKDDFVRYTHQSIDFYIVNNDIMLNEMKKVTDKPVYVIPHHNCNFLKKHNMLKGRPKRLGYVGLPEQTIHEDSMISLCKKLDVSFTSQDVTSHDQLDEAFSKIDIGIVYFDRDDSKSEYQSKILRYKPATKLSNFQSYGIPTVCLPYESFKQFGGGKNVFVDSFEDLENAVERLVKDEEAYSSLASESLVQGESLHIEKVVDYYHGIAKDLET